MLLKRGGVCVAAAYRLNPSLFEYTPLQVKQAVTGYGRAEKTASAGHGKDDTGVRSCTPTG